MTKVVEATTDDSDEDTWSFCELLEAVEDWLADSDGHDLCDAGHLIHVGFKLMAVGAKLQALDELGFNRPRH